VFLDRSAERLDAFFAAHGRGQLDPVARIEARRLLELERNRLLMYTSCGWFFDEISAIEPAQILRYAAMALQYMNDLGGGRLEDEFTRRLAAAPSNIPEMRDGAEVYRHLIRPTAVNLGRVVTHYAITGSLEEHPADTRIYAYRVERLDEARETSDGTTLAVGHMRVTSKITGETRETVYALAHFGGHDFSCGVRTWDDRATYDALKADLLARCARQSVADLVRGLDEYFPGGLSSLSHLFLDERRRVLANVIRATLERHEETYRKIWEENRKLVHYLREADAPIPEALAIIARHVLEQQVTMELLSSPDLATIPDRVVAIVDEARALGLTLDLMAQRLVMQRAVARALELVAESPARDRIANATGLIEGARRLGIRYGHWAAQNAFFQTWRERADARADLLPLANALGFSLEA